VLCGSELEILVTQLETILLGIWPNTGCSSSTNKLNDENVYSVSSLFKDLATAKLLKDISAFGVPGPESADDSKSSEGSAESCSRLFGAIRRTLHLTARPWWTCTWVIQDMIFTSTTDLAMAMEGHWQTIPIVEKGVGELELRGCL
jgi:hypothetical protein